MKKLAISVFCFLLILSGCATTQTPTRAELALTSKNNTEKPASRQEVLEISNDLKERIYELDKKETLSRIVAWSHIIPIILSVALGITTTALLATHASLKT